MHTMTSLFCLPKRERLLKAVHLQSDGGCLTQILGMSFFNVCACHAVCTDFLLGPSTQD